MEIPLKKLKKKSFCSKDQVVGMSEDCPCCCYSHSIMSDSFVTAWTLACQALLSTGFPRQEYWSGLQFLSPWDLPDPGVKPASPEFAGGFFTIESSGKQF